MSDRTEVVVVGGGAAGCAVAYYLSRAGAASTVIERDGVASKASGFSAGALNPLEGAGIPGPLGPLGIESFRMHKAMWDDLRDESGVDFQPRTVSTLRLAFDDLELEGMEEAFRAYEAANGFSARYLDSTELHALEPRIAQDAFGALYVHGNTALDSYLYTLALSTAARRRGVELRSASVSGLRTSGGRVDGVITDSGETGCEAVVLAMGPWTARAERWLGVPIPVEPLKGEILRVRLPGPALEHELTYGHSSPLRPERRPCLDRCHRGAPRLRRRAQRRGAALTAGRRGPDSAGGRGRGDRSPHGVSPASYAGLAPDSRQGPRLGQRIPGHRRRQEGHPAESRDRQSGRRHDRSRHDNAARRPVQPRTLRAGQPLFLSGTPPSTETPDPPQTLRCHSG